MRGLWLLACRNWVSNRARTALVTLAVCLGVAAAMGSLTTVALIRGDLQAAALSASGPADLEVSALAEQGFPMSAAEQVRTIPGVERVTPLLEKRTYFRSEQQRGFIQVTGIDPSAEMALTAMPLRVGRWPRPGEDAVALSETWAAGERLGLGAGLELVTTDGLRPFTVVGLVAQNAPAGTEAPGGPSLAAERAAFMPLGTAQQAFGMVDRTTHLALKLAGAEDRESVVALLATALPGRFVLADALEHSEGLRLAVEQLVAGLLVFGASALFVGGLLIHNTLSMTVAERRQSIGLLRTAGLLRRQILVLILIEVLAIAIVGSLLGLLLGSALALVLAAWLQQGAGLPVSGFPVQPEAIALSVTLGLGIPLVSALVPAWRACCIAPVAAIRAVVPGIGLVRTRWWLIAVLLVGGGVALLAPTPTDVAPLVRGSGLLIWLAIVYLGAVSLVGPLARFGAMPFRWLCGAEGLLAELNLRRAPQRAGLTVVGITVSVALAMVLAELNSSAASAGQGQIAALFPEGVLIVPPVPQPERLADPFWKQPGVGRVTLLRSLSVASGTSWLDAMAIEPSEYTPSAALPLTDGDRGAALRRLEEGRAVLVPTGAARAYGLNVGGRLPLETLQGTLDFEVVGMLAYSFPSADDLGAVVISRADAIHYFGADTFTLLLATPGHGVPLAALAERLAPEAERYGMQAVSIGTLRDAISDKVGRLFLLLGSLVGVGGIVAALAIATTVLMNLTERKTEIGVLRALGLTDRQVKRMFLVEAATLGLMGGVLGLVSGWALGWVLLQLVRTPDLDLRPIFPALPAALILIGAVTLSTVAAILPAHRLAGRRPGGSF